MSSSRPPELYIDEKWDKVLDLGLRRIVYGGLTGGLAGLVLSRGATARVAFLALGVGFGAGSAYQESTREFESIFAKTTESKD